MSPTISGCRRGGPGVPETAEERKDVVALSGKGSGDVTKLHVSIPDDVLRALEVRRELERINRSEAITEALRLWLAQRDEGEFERRTRSAERLEDLAELVGGQGAALRERLDRQADRIARMVERDRWATETLYALLEETIKPELGREEARRIAARTVRGEKEQRAGDQAPAGESLEGSHRPAAGRSENGV